VNFSLGRDVIRPVIVPVLGFAVAATVIITIGQIFLHFYDHSLDDEIRRREIWFGTLLALAFLGIGAALVLSKKDSGKPGLLDKDVIIGSKPMFADSGLTPVSSALRTGERGSVADISEGYRLFARSGEFARVIGQVAGGTEGGRTFKGYLYAEGMRGIAKELWIPVEAVLDVFPDTGSAFLAIQGDEAEAFGWNVPPQSFNRALYLNEPPKTL
jgi:hypothetical protein